MDLLEQRTKEDLLNRKTLYLPKYDPQKCDLPKRSNFIGTISWLKAVRDCIGESVVFALDEALMCQGNFGGHSDEYVVWVYGNDSVTRFNEVVVFGNYISPQNVISRNGLQYTGFNRTVFDAFANESILDMQGITEAVSKYYTLTGKALKEFLLHLNIRIDLKSLANEAIEYYAVVSKIDIIDTN